MHGIWGHHFLPDIIPVKSNIQLAIMNLFCRIVLFQHFDQFICQHHTTLLDPDKKNILQIGMDLKDGLSKAFYLVDELNMVENFFHFLNGLNY